SVRAWVAALQRTASRCAASGTRSSALPSTCRVGKAQRAHRSRALRAAWWARRKSAFAHPTAAPGPGTRGRRCSIWRAASALALDGDLHEIGLVGRNGLRERGRDVVGVVDADAFDAHARGEMHEIEGGAGQIHLLIGMLGTRLKILAPDVGIVLEDAVFAV